MNKPIHGGGRTGGMTLGFDGKAEFAPIMLLRLYNCDMKVASFLLRGDVAELALKRQDRIVLNDPDDVFEVIRVIRAGEGQVSITIGRKDRWKG